MPTEVRVTNVERNQILSSFQLNSRADGRKNEQFRQAWIEFGEENGVVDVRLGKTRVLAKVSCEITTPFMDRKFDGIFNISCEFSAMAIPGLEVGRPNESEVFLTRMLEKSIRRAGALNTESLCIISGQKCFAIRVDLHIIQHDGGLVDAACIATMAALHDFRRPDVEVSESGSHVKVFAPNERAPVKLNIQHTPVISSFSLYELMELEVSSSAAVATNETIPSVNPIKVTTNISDDINITKLNGSQHHDKDKPVLNNDTKDESTVIISDATRLEEQYRNGVVVVCVNDLNEVCLIGKYGGWAIEACEMLALIRLAEQRSADIVKMLNKKLADRESLRHQ